MLSAVIVTSSRGSGRSRWHQSHPRHVTLGTSTSSSLSLSPSSHGNKDRPGQGPGGERDEGGMEQHQGGVGSLSPLPHGGPQERGHPPCDLSGDRGAESPGAPGQNHPLEHEALTWQ